MNICYFLCCHWALFDRSKSKGEKLTKRGWMEIWLFAKMFLFYMTYVMPKYCHVQTFLGLAARYVLQAAGKQNCEVLYPCSTKTRAVLGNPSLTPKRFPKTREICRKTKLWGIVHSDLMQQSPSLLCVWEGHLYDIQKIFWHPLLAPAIGMHAPSYEFIPLSQVM